jgi:organic radical activating enzyme
MSGELVSIKSAVVKITDRCNQDCAFCLDKGVTPKMHMTVEEINALLDNLKLDCDQLIFMGGETLLVPSFEKVVAHAKAIGYRAVGIATNGTLLGKEDYLGRLLEAGLDYLELSLIHVEPEVVERITRRPFTYERMIQALESLNARPLRADFFVLFNVVLNALNREDLLKIVKTINERYPNFRRRYNFKSMVMRGSATLNEWIRTPYSKIRMKEAFSYLEKTGVPFWTENVPLCAAPGFEWHSLNATTRAFDRTYKDIDFQAPDKYYDTGFHDTGKVQPSGCRKCTLRAICLGVELGYIQFFGTREFKPSKRDPVEVVRQVLQGGGGDPAQAEEIHDGLQRFFRLGPYEEKDRVYLYFRKGTHRRATYMVAPVEEETRPLIKTGKHQVVYLGDGGPARPPDEEEIELLRSLARSVGFLDKHHPDEVVPWCLGVKKEFEDGTLFPGNWVLLPESRYMRYY